MRYTKSYMVPKLICLNMLALMMFTFEHKTTADEPLLLKTAKAKQPATSNEAVVMQVSATQTTVEPQPAAATEKPVEVRKTAVYKKRLHRSARAQPMLIHAGYKSNSPVDCCFRGNRT